MDFFFPAAMAQAEGGQTGSNPLPTLLMFLGLGVFMYLFMIRPQQKRQKEHKGLVESLAKGDEVLLNSGLVGKINKVDENYVVLEVGDKIELKFQKASVSAVLPKGTIKSI